MSSSRRVASMFTCIFIALCSQPEGTAASEGPPPVLNVKTYLSPSGEYSLRVIPSDILGRGKATYILSKDNGTIWSEDKPYTLWEAGVTDTGLICGYAYTHGWRGFALEGGYKAGMGDFHVVTLSDNGAEVLNEVTSREPSQFLHTPPNPLAHGIVVDQDNDLFMVRVKDPDVNERSESWWVYQISTGKALRRFAPKEKMTDLGRYDRVVAAQHILGTPLVLLHWWRFDSAASDPKSGGRFSLINTNGDPVWHVDLPGDYSIPGDRDSESQLRREIWKGGALLSGDAPGRFDVRFVADALRVSFGVERGDQGAWIVREIRRVPYQDAPADEPELELAEHKIERLTPLVLKPEVTSAIHPVRSVRGFTIDQNNRICFMRSDSDTQALVLLDDKGRVISEVPLDSIQIAGNSRWTGHAWIGDDRYVLTRSESGVGGRASAWFVDMDLGELKAIEGFDCPSIQSIDGFPDGSFVALATMRHRSSMTTSAYAFNKLGERAWELQQSYGKSPEHLFSPKDIAVTTEGNVVVLDVIRKTIQMFDRNGKYLRTFELEDAWGRKPKYPCSICADTSGGFVVEDFSATPPVIRMTADGALRSEVTPQHSDGRTIQIRDFAVSTNGQFWVSDGHSLIRLGDDGIVVQVLGSKPNTDELGTIAGITLDRKENIYAVSQRTGAVHVFDSAGDHLRTCKPDPTEIHGDVSLPTITVNDLGEVYLRAGPGSNRAGGYIHFSTSCEMMGNNGIGGEASRLKWFSQPGTGRIWGLGYENVVLLDSTFAPVRTIKQRPDGHWLERPHSAGVAPDGSIAVVAHSKKMERDDSATVNLYDAQGEPLQTVQIPTSMGEFLRVAYDGEHLIVAGNDGVLSFSMADNSARRFVFDYESSKEPYWYPFIVTNGRELLLFDGNRQTAELLRFRLP